MDEDQDLALVGGAVMKMKICPCCDQPIEGIYCKGCRKIVWKPVEQDVNYYLNVRHPAYDHDCTFHEAAAVPKSDDRMNVSEIEAKSGTQVSKQKKGIRMLIMVFLLWFVLSCAGIFFTMINLFI